MGCVVRNLWRVGALWVCLVGGGVLLSSGCDRLESEPPRKEGEIVKRGGAEQDVQMVDKSNARMNAAFAEARRTLPRFLEALQHPKRGQTFLLKIRLTDGTHTEYIWLRGLSHQDQQFHGTLVDNPFEVTGYQAGQKMTVADKDGYDWIIMQGNTITDGGFTEQVLREMNDRSK